ncbi:MAG: energy-coupling factor transporter ATPase [Lachnospiraceae bacterium]
MSMIDVDQVSFAYERMGDDGKVTAAEPAVSDVSMAVSEGEFVAVLGHNGSGKSTLAKHFNALLLPTEGAVYVDQMHTADECNLWDIRHTVGMVFQNPDNQIIAGVVEEDVGFGPENMGVPTEGIWERVEDSLGAVDMLRYRKHSPNKLSGGQKQRVAIAGVVAMRPKCIVLDEPTAMLDPQGRQEVLQAIRSLHDAGVTIVLITHDMEEALCADRVMVMNDGRLVMNGTPREVFAHVRELQQIGLGVPQMEWLAYELRSAGMPISEDIMTRQELVRELSALLSQTA